MEDIKILGQNEREADKLDHWDFKFWSERLRESRFHINEVDMCVCACAHVFVSLCNGS